MNISHQLFDYKITLVNAHQLNTNTKGDFYSKTGFKFLTLNDYKLHSPNQIWVKIYIFDSDMILRMQFMIVKG